MQELTEFLLDTNFVWDWFLKAIKAYRKSEEEFESVKPSLTRKMEFLLRSRYKLSTTNVARSEVYRKLVSEMSANKELCPFLWNTFLKTFKVLELEVNFVNFFEVAELCLVTHLSQGSIPNLVQLQFSKKENIPFATGDNAIRDNYRTYFSHVYTYIELRQIFDSRQSSL